MTYVSGSEGQQSETIDPGVVSDNAASWSALKVSAKDDSRRTDEVIVCFPDDLCLVRTGIYPDVAPAELDNIISLEIGTTTPFSATNAAWTWRRRDDGKTDVVIVKRETLDLVRSHAEAAGLVLKEFRPEADGQAAPPFEVYETPTTRRERFWQKINTVLVLALTTLIITFYGVSYVQKSQVLAELKASIAEKTNEARTLRAALNAKQKEADAARALNALKNDRASVVESWARITRLLPSNAWASELTLDKSGGTIVGFTGNAASLIELLERDQALRNVTFKTAVRIDPHSKAERFDIRFAHEYPAQFPAPGKTKP
ncbi:PilN domain-containing protein [Roseibium sp. MMSF_3412]|uniref:PilN domain-containing protein n=1 Tax=Roseibium sp. MMSF_3412 TaxID=3046712 RepID=UPI00273FD1D4|nr:PilN domain-containing protein [Roseibium sp. MMSF_3412]